MNLDYNEDFVFLKRLFEALYPVNNLFTLEEIIKWLDQNPEISKINKLYVSKDVKFWGQLVFGTNYPISFIDNYIS